MSIKTQGTHLYFIDTVSSSDPAVVKLHCPTGITGLGGPSTQIDTTCLDDFDRTFAKGLGNPGEVSVPFNFDPQEVSHQMLFDLKEDGRNLAWYMGLSDGTAAPTLDTNDAFVIPTSRSGFQFEAYVSDVNIDVATDEIVRGTLTLQRSGAVVMTWKV